MDNNNKLNWMAETDEGFAKTEQDVSAEKKKKTRQEVPLWHKRLLTLEEAADYTGLGLQKLRDISNDETCKFVLWNGRKRLFKREQLEKYLEMAYSV